MDKRTAQIDEIKARWMTGGSAAASCPDAWREALGDDAPELSLLALAGQFTRLATAPSTGDLTVRAPLPRLDLPCLSGELRPLFRRVLDGRATQVSSLLTFIAARGVTTHPNDWMPKASSEVPDVYGPWIDWINDETGGSTDETLNAENWDDWLPHARRAMLVQLRRTAPEAARALIAAKAGDVPAEQRIRLIAVLQDGLSEADVDLLEALGADRSGKVKALAHNMLARLGKSKADQEALTEFAAFFETQKAGILSRKKIVVARKLKTNAQKTRRFELANALPLSALADAFNMTPDALIDTFDLGEGSGALIAMTAATGTAQQALCLVERIRASKSDPDISLLERLDDADRIETARSLAKGDNTAFRTPLHALGAHLGSLDYDTLSRAPATAALQTRLKKQQDVDTTLSNLGLIASQDAATRLLKDFTDKYDLMAADPRLAMLRLNASLPDNAPKET